MNQVLGNLVENFIRELEAAKINRIFLVGAFLCGIWTINAYKKEIALRGLLGERKLMMKMISS